MLLRFQKKTNPPLTQPLPKSIGRPSKSNGPSSIRSPPSPTGSVVLTPTPPPRPRNGGRGDPRAHLLGDKGRVASEAALGSRVALASTGVIGLMNAAAAATVDLPQPAAAAVAAAAAAGGDGGGREGRSQSLTGSSVSLGAAAVAGPAGSPALRRHSKEENSCVCVY